MRRKGYVALAATVALALAVWAWSQQQHAGTAPQLSADLPPGALLTIESPNFARLLQDWERSPEEKSWLHSASSSAFADSRLYGRLVDAESEFAGVAGAQLGTQFLQQVAGTESIFAWYDIGNLEFLYITHLAPGQAANITLLQQRGQYQQRQAGDTAFYVRSGTAAGDSSDEGGQQRTVAFAVRGDWLVLATREDLIANALLLMQQSGATSASMADQAWYRAAETADPQPHGDLHMLLDLHRITRTPQFETYWIQQNVTDMRQYRAAVVDLYREPERFREERVLLPENPDAGPTDSPDVSALALLVPQRAGVFRAVASPTTASALAALSDKVLERTPTTTSSGDLAPAADLSVPEPGSASDFETRIDQPLPVQAAPDAWLNPLRLALQNVPLTAMLTVSRTESPSGGSMFIHIESAVVFRRDGAWDAQTFSAAVLQALHQRLTTGGAGLVWKPASASARTFLEAGSMQPVSVLVNGNTAIVSTDPDLLNDIFARMKQPANAPPVAAYSIAEFRHTQEQAAYAQLSGTLDEGSGSKQQQAGVETNGSEGQAQPTFFRDVAGGLSRTFSDMQTERIVERRQGRVVRQTVVYGWK